MTSSYRNRILAAIGLISAFTGFNAKADIFTSCGVDLGLAGRTKIWAAFTLDGGIDSSKHNDLGDTHIFGDVGAAGNGNIKMGSKAHIHGSVYYRQPGYLTMAGGASVDGSIFHDNATDALLDQAKADAIAASAFAFNLPVSAGFPSTIVTGSNMTLVATSTCTVLRLTDFILTGGLFTLQGTAGQAFIINVTHNFSLQGGAQIVLSGGLQPADVLFNVVGTGNDVSFDQNTTLHGILMANQRIVKVKNGSRIIGEVIAGQLQITSGSQILTPATPP